MFNHQSEKGNSYDTLTEKQCACVRVCEQMVPEHG